MVVTRDVSQPETLSLNSDFRKKTSSKSVTLLMSHSLMGPYFDSADALSSTQSVTALLIFPFTICSNRLQYSGNICFVVGFSDGNLDTLGAYDGDWVVTSDVGDGAAVVVVVVVLLDIG